MRYKQMSLGDIYSEVRDMFENSRCRFFGLLREHINWDELIPWEFYSAYYASLGRNRDYSLVSMICFFVVKSVFGIIHDNTLLNVLKYSAELREYIGFDDRIPDAAQISRFRFAFVEYIQMLFDKTVDITEPICRKIGPELAACLNYDSTGVESCVKENNPKFFNSKLRQAKPMAKGNPEINPYKAVYGLLPETALSNPNVKQQYINGHFCRARKFGIITNGLGIIRGVTQLGEDFKEKHPEMLIEKRSDNPDVDKEISGSASLKPVLSDFMEAHPNAKFDTFLGDSAFDSYDNYSMLMDDFHFERVLIPINVRSSANAHSGFDENGIPLCPKTNEPMVCLGKSGGKNRSVRIKFVCPESVPNGGSHVCGCPDPCTDSNYGRCVYIYPDKERRLFPGIVRKSPLWDRLYKNRTAAERTIGCLKNDLAVAGRRTPNVITTRADFLFAAIAQLLGVVIADKLDAHHLSRRIRHILNAA